MPRTLAEAAGYNRNVLHIGHIAGFEEPDMALVGVEDRTELAGQGQDSEGMGLVQLHLMGEDNKQPGHHFGCLATVLLVVCRHEALQLRLLGLAANHVMELGC